MLSNARVLFFTLVSVFVFTLAGSQQTEPQDLPQPGLVQSVSSAVQNFFQVPLEPGQDQQHDHDEQHHDHEQAHDHDEAETEKGQETPPDTSLAVVNSTSNGTEVEDEHTRINRELADDEERVMAKGEVKIRKKRTFCKSCYPTMSYGYGGGGGCCGACGQCGGGYSQQYIRPVKVYKIKVRPVFYGGGGYGGGGGCCYQQQQCGVCGRK